MYKEQNGAHSHLYTYCLAARWLACDVWSLGGKRDDVLSLWSMKLAENSYGMELGFYSLVVVTQTQLSNVD